MALATEAGAATATAGIGAGHRVLHYPFSSQAIHVLFTSELHLGLDIRNRSGTRNKSGTNPEQNRNKSGTNLAQNLNKSGTSPEQIRNKSGTEPEQIRNKSRTKPEQIRNIEVVRNKS
jgi:hypothetical protein